MDMPHTKAIHDATRIPFSIARPIMISPMLISPSSMNSVVLTDTPVSIWKSNSSIPQCCIGAMPCLASRKFTQTNSNGAMKCQVATTPITVAIQKRRTHRAAMNSVAIEATGQRSAREALENEDADDGLVLPPRAAGEVYRAVAQRHPEQCRHRGNGSAISITATFQNGETAAAWALAPD